MFPFIKGRDIIVFFNHKLFTISKFLFFLSSTTGSGNLTSLFFEIYIPHERNVLEHFHILSALSHSVIFLTQHYSSHSDTLFYFQNTSISNTEEEEEN